MPELPEVETVVRDLRPLLVGRTIVSVRHGKKKLRRPWRKIWNAAVVGARVESLRRRGKWILVDLTGQTLLRVHLGMTGQFTVAPESETEPDHLHLVFALDDSRQLRFRDPRRFGAAEWFADRAAVELQMNAELGPEPFDLDPDSFCQRVRSSSRSVKAILLDQTVIAGVGNIYADEACFLARIHPGRRGTSLTRQECEQLRLAIEEVLTRAIESRGSSIRDYIGGSGLRGGFQDEFAVYGRTADPCLTCESPIRSMRLAGRSSHFCPRCQRMPLQRTRRKSQIQQEKP